MITCEHLLGFLTDYVENTLASVERAYFRRASGRLSRMYRLPA